MWTLSFIILGIALANERLLSQGYSRRLTKLGATEYTLRQNDAQEHSVVYFPDKNTISTMYMTKLTEKIKSGKPLLDLNNSTITCAKGEGPDYFRFVPQFKGSAKPGQDAYFNNECLYRNLLEVTEVTDTSIEFSIVGFNFDPLKVCYDSYFVAILNNFHVFTLEVDGLSKSFRFDNLTADIIADVEQNGIRVFSFCDGIEDLTLDLLMTIQLFLGGLGLDPNIPIFGSHTTKEQERANIEFLTHAIGYTMEPRTVNNINIDPNEIHSGDFLAVTRLDGLDEIIMWGTGGRVGHSTMALWITESGIRELYVVESQAGWYWPNAGLQRTKFAQWVEWAENASFNVVVLPLKDEYRAIFDEAAVYEYFTTVEGMPYGYHNFLFGWIDTVSDNFPPILSPEIFTIGFSLVEEIIPSAIESIYTLAINRRLGTQGLKIAGLEQAAYLQGKTLPQVQAEVELDEWEYPDGYSFVCSSFVLVLYKKAGILNQWLPLQGTEFTPKDVYSLNIFNSSAVLPDICKKSDPTLPYCQILGEYRIDLGSDYASIAPYPNMNQYCASAAPEFLREPAGC